MKKLPSLSAGDSVEVIAPAARCSDKQLTQLKALLESWGLKCLVSDTIFGQDLLCANTDQSRLAHLKKSLFRPETKAVICARGGYGSMRLIPELANMMPPATPKLFIGMSDITALHLFLQQQWAWPTLHGSLTVDKLSTESIDAMKAFLFSESKDCTFAQLKPLNPLAAQEKRIESTLIGGNLTLVQASIGTDWQLQARGKIVLLEEIGERGYRVDRMLEHLRQACLFKDVEAIIFADFLECEEPDGGSLIRPLLERFAKQCAFPVMTMEGVGHGRVNFPVPFGTRASLKLGRETRLIIEK